MPSSGVVREVYTGLSGGTIPDLTNSPSFPNNPTDIFLDPTFEAPNNFADYYGQRVRALVVPPVSGSYTFWIASDDNSVLYLSSDETPAHKTPIAYESSWAGWRAWNTHPTQKSAPVSLTAGRRYYLEALQKEGAGGDNLSVAWQKPGDPAPADGALPIAGQYLVPYGLGPPIITVQPANVSLIEGGTAAFSLALSVKIGAVYQWRRNGAVITGATNSVYALGPVTLADSLSQFSCAITNWFGDTNSASATLTVNPDITRPTLVSAGSLGEPQVVSVIFSEPVEPASATLAGNYGLSGGASVLSASFGLDSRTIILTTTPLLSSASYVLTVDRVRDRASTPNMIATNSQVSFSVAPLPLDISYVRPTPETPGASSRHGPLVVSEVMYHPAPRADGRNLEFIEVFNSSPVYEDLSGYRITGSVDFTFPANTSLAGRGVIVVAAAPADIRSVYGIANVIGPYTNNLPNSSGKIRLLNRQGGILFEVNYSGDPPWPPAADGAGHSLLLAWPSLGERNPAAWSVSSLIGGTPGRLETATYNPYRQVLINEILAHTDPPDFDYVELFNYGSTPIDLSGCVLTDDPDTNKFLIPPGTTIQPLGFAVFAETQLGFGLSAAGETVYLKDPSNTRVIDALRFGAQENGVAFGRYPDGAKEFYRLQDKTPGASNARQRQAEVVINELMYAPISEDDNDQYVELYNRSGSPVDVSRWRVEDGISYTIPPATVIPAGGYLVVAKNALHLMTNYPNLSGLNTVGDFSGSLAGSGERIALSKPDEIVSTNSAGQYVTNTIHIVVDEVTYDVGGRWGKWSKGGGSSLELVDANADHRLAPNWADSNETTKSAWTTVEYTGVLENGNGAADSLQILALGAGEYLVDNVEVFAAGGQNLVTNPGFESGLAGWVPQGNHEDSTLETREGYNSPQSLHVRTTDHGDTGANRIRTTLASALNQGQTVTIRAKVRWLAGCPEILFRLHGNWLEATTNILTASRLGTPGAVNSRLRLNAGPAITEVRHVPALPVPGQGVTVAARVHDPDALAALFLKYRVDPATNYSIVNMVNNGAGLFSGVIPGQSAGVVVAFYLEALDNKLPRQVGRFPNDAPARECLVRFGDPGQAGNFGTYRLWMTQATFKRWSQREHLSNKPLDCTFVYGNSRVIYNMGAQYSGSPWHAPGFDSPTGNVCDYLLTFNDDDPFLGETDATLQWPGNGGGDNTYQREQTAYWLGEQIGLPYCYRRSINLYVNGTRRAEMFEDVQQPNGNMMDEFYPEGRHGDLHKIQIWFEFDDAAATFSSVGASLGNVLTSAGQKSLPRYRWTWAKRAVHGSSNNYTNLYGLVDAANYPGVGIAYRRQLAATADIDNWLKTYAIEHVVANGDSFAYGGGQNMYCYKPLDDTWKMLIWDIDFAFSAGDPNSDVFQGIGRSNGMDLGDPVLARRYWEILQDLATGPLTATKMYPLLDARYNAMTANGRTIENPASIKTFVDTRRAYLLNRIATNAFANFAITLNNGNGFSTSQNLVILTGTAPLGVRMLLINGVAFAPLWTSPTNWTAQAVLAPGTNTLVVQGLGANGTPVAGASASIPINYTGSVQSPVGALVINEIMYNPAVPNASFIELYNGANNAFDLSGWRISGADFVFPAGTLIGARSYLVVPGDQLAFASAYGKTLATTGEFSGTLQNNGETLQLIQPGASSGPDLVVAEVHYESRAPWPAAANGTGPSLQLIDPAQDNARVANWAVAVSKGPAPGPQWRYVVAPGTASSSALYIYLQSAGDVYLDDLKLVAGTVAELGPNLLADGDFETGFPGPWGVSANLAGSVLSTSIKHSGAAGLHLVASSGGSTRASSIYQDISPALTLGAPYTLSFWVLENTNGGTLTLRLSNSGISTSVDLLPAQGSLNLALTTPGSTNSIARVLPPLPRLWLNEVLPVNNTGATDRFGHRHAWAELYNNGTTNLNLSGMFLANNYTNLLQWPFPSGTSIAAGQYLLVWVDGNPAESISTELHTSFSIPSFGGALALVSTNGGSTNILDYLNYGPLQPDRSYGAYPNGSPGRRQSFYFPTPASSNNAAAPLLSVVINEWMPDNQTTLADPADNDFEDWFELYNESAAPADLSGYYLGQSLTNRTKFQIPNGYTIPPYGYLLVWADDETGQNSSNRIDLHVNFKLSKNGDGIGLFAPDQTNTVIDFVSFGALPADASQGRYPDGWSTLFNFASPTPRGTNIFQLPNTTPRIGTIAPQTIFAGQLLSFLVPATDADTPPQQLSFSLASGCPPNATVNADTGLFSWRPSEEQTPSTNTFTVQVVDNGNPPLGVSATFEVRVAPRPQIMYVTPSGSGGYFIEFTTTPGQTYRVDYKDNLQDAQWSALTPGFYCDGDKLMVIDSNPGIAQRFYRVAVVQ